MRNILLSTPLIDSCFCEMWEWPLLVTSHSSLVCVKRPFSIHTLNSTYAFFKLKIKTNLNIFQIIDFNVKHVYQNICYTYASPNRDKFDTCDFLAAFLGSLSFAFGIIHFFSISVGFLYRDCSNKIKIKWC